MKQHRQACLNNMSMFAFNMTILLRGVKTRYLVKSVIIFKKFTNNVIEKFSTPVTLKNFDGPGKLSLDKFNKCC